MIMGIFSLLTSDWGSAMRDLSHRLLKIVLISLSEFINSIFTIKSLSDDFIGLHKLVDLPGKFIILVGDNPDVVVH